MTKLSCIYTLSDDINIEDISKQCNIPEGSYLEKQQIIDAIYEIAAEKDFNAADYTNHIDEIKEYLIKKFYNNDTVYIEDEEKRESYNTKADTLRYNLKVDSVLDFLRKSNYIHKFRGEYYFSVHPKAGEELSDEKAKKSLEDVLIAMGLPPNAVYFSSVYSGLGRKIKITNFNKTSDYIVKEDETDEESILKVVSFLQTKFPYLKDRIHYVDSNQLSELLKGEDKKVNLSSVNSFVKNGTVYLVKGRVTKDIAIEECLHPFVGALQIENKKLFDNLYIEASKLFPSLKHDIEITYASKYGFKEKDRRNELVTQSLSRYFREDFDLIEESGSRKTFMQYVNDFVKWLKELFSFINPKTNNYVIDVEDFGTNATFADISELLNISDIEIHNRNNSDTFFNIKELKQVSQNLGDTNVLVTEKQANKLKKLGIRVYKNKDNLYIANIPRGVDEIQVAETKKPNTLNDNVKLVEDAIKVLNLKVKKSKDFNKSHTYEITTSEGKTVKVRNSVTKVASKLAKTPEYKDSDSAWNQLILDMGNDFDEIVRQFFKGKLADEIYTTGVVDKVSIIEDIKKYVVPFLNKKFPKGYKVITTEMLLGGKYNGEYIAGATDMLIATNDGIWIVDMKTAFLDSETGQPIIKKEQYGYQLLLYKELLKENFPQLADKIRGTVLLVANRGTKEAFPNRDSVYRDSNGIYRDSDTHNKLSIPKLKIYFNTTRIDPNNNWIYVGDDLNVSGVSPLSFDIDFLTSDKYIDDLIKELESQESNKEAAIEKNLNVVEYSEPTTTTIVDDANKNIPLPPSEKTYIGRQIIHLISDACDDIINGTFYLKDSDPIFEKLVGTSPAKVLSNPKVLNIIKESIKDLYFSPYIYEDYDDIMLGKVKWIRDHFDQIINESISEIISIEHITIGGNHEVIVEGDAENPIDLYDIAEMEESFREGYYIENREVHFESLVPKELKRKLSKIKNPELNKVKTDFGEYEVNKYGYLGIPEYLDKHYILHTLYDKLHNKHNYSEMLSTLENFSEEYPWMKDVIGIVGDDYQLQSLFVRTFWKDKVLYTSVYDTQVDGKTAYVVNILNQGEARQALTTIWEDSKFNSGVFEESTKESTNLNLSDKWNKKLAKNRLDSKLTKDLLTALGFNVIDIKKASKDREVISNLGAILVNKKRDIGSIDRLAKKLINSLSPYYNSVSDLTVYENGKSYSVYVEPSELGIILSNLANSESSIYENGEISENSIYKNYRYFGIREDDGTFNFINPWLQKLNDDPKSRKLIGNVVANTSTLGSNFNDQDNKKYLITILSQYFAPSADSFKQSLNVEGAKGIALFRVPTMSDKNAEDSVLFYKVGEIDKQGSTEKLQKNCADIAFDYFLYEVNRFKAIIDAYREGNSDRLVKIWKPKNISIESDTVIDKDFYLKDNNVKKELLESGLTFRYLYSLNDYIFGNKKSYNDIRDLRKFIFNILNGKESSEKILHNAAEQFKKLYIEDIERSLENFINVSTNLIGTDSLKSITGQKTDRDTVGKLREFYYNDSIATLNILNLTIQDPAYFKNVIDFQKRFAQMHASAAKPNVEAKFIDKRGVVKDYSDGYQRVVVIKDDIRNDIKTMGEQVKTVFLERAKLYPKNSVRYNEMISLSKSVPPMFEEVVATDGQSFVGPTAYWKRLGMLGEDVKGIKEALDKISKGDFRIADVNVVLQPFKPFVTAKVDKPLDDNFGNELVPVQIKNSEALILLHNAIMKSQGIDYDNPVSVLFDFMEASAYKGEGNTDNLEEFFKGKHGVKYNDTLYNGRGIDTIVFESSVKNGVYGVLDLQSKDRTQMVEELKKCIDPNTGDYSDIYVKTYPITKWGKQQNTPPHMQDKEQPRGSQVTVLAVSDIDDKAQLKVRGESKVQDKANFIHNYLQLLTKDFELGIQEARDILGLTGDNWKQNLSKLLIESLNRDGKYSVELRRAFTLVNGEFQVPIGDPILADKIYSTIFNVIKKHVNSSDMPGGPVVQVSEYEYSEDLKLIKDEESGGYIFESYITCPTSEIENLVVRNGKIRTSEEVIKELESNIKLYKNNPLYKDSVETWKGQLERFKNSLEFIAYRIPTEDKYSIFKCKVKGFLPRQSGEVAILPRAIVTLSGTDYDIDKLYCMFRYNNPSTERQEVKNRIYEYMWAALSEESALEKFFNPGNFEILKKLAGEVDPNFGNIRMDITKVETQLRLHESNAAGKTFVGIAALNNVSHAISTFAPIVIKSKPVFKIKIEDKIIDTKSDRNFSTIGNVYSPFNGARISRTLGMFVGASADNAKEAVLQSLNITPITANIAMTMLRYGIPLDTVVYMLNIPAIKALSTQAERTGARFEELLEETDSKNQPDNHFLSNETLKKLIEGKSNEDVAKSESQIVAGIIKQFLPISKDLSAFNQIASLGSVKNAVGPTVYDVIRKSAYINYAQQTMADGAHLDFSNIFRECTHLKPLADCYTKLVPEICSKFSPIFKSDFQSLVRGMGDLGGIDSLTDKNLKHLLDIYLLHVHKVINSITDKDGNITYKTDAFKNKGLIKQIIAERFNNEFLQSLSILRDVNKKNKNIPNVIFKNQGKTREQKDDLTASWIELFRENESLANDIFEYMFTRFGFSWMPNSAINIAPNIIRISSIKGIYDNIIVENITLDPLHLSSVMNEFIRNFLPYGIVKTTEDANTVIKGYFKYKGKLYFSDDGKSKVEVGTLGIPNQYIEIKYPSTDNSNTTKSRTRVKERDKTESITPKVEKSNTNKSEDITDKIANSVAKGNTEKRSRIKNNIEKAKKEANLCKSI